MTFAMVSASVSPGTQRARSAFRTARTRTPRCPCACRRACPAPAPGSCTREYREARHRSCRCASRSAPARDRRQRRRRLWLSPGRSPAPSPRHRPSTLMFAGFRSRWTMPVRGRSEARGRFAARCAGRRRWAVLGRRRRPAMRCRVVRRGCHRRRVPARGTGCPRRAQSREWRRCSDDSARPACGLRDRSARAGRDRS